MSDYLQRLLERSVPTLPPAAGVLPAGPSQSPISLSDQRTNDPDFAGSYAPTTDAREQYGDAAPESPRSTKRQSLEQPGTDHRPPEPAALRPEPAPPQKSERALQIPTIEIAQSPPQHPLPTGYVDATDLLLPESEPTTQGREDTFSPPRAAQPIPLDSPAAPSEPAAPTESTETPLPPQEPSRPTPAALEIAEVTPSPPRPKIEPPPQTSAEDLTRAQAPLNSPVEPEPRSAVEVMPPPLDMPALPDLPPTPPRQPEPVSVPPPAIQMAQQAQQNTASSETRRTRPMTAASASIIGELTPRRRALTIFGLRRR